VLAQLVTFVNTTGDRFPLTDHPECTGTSPRAAADRARPVLGAFFAPLLLAAPPPAFVEQRAAVAAFLAGVAPAAPAARAAAAPRLTWFSASDTHLGHDPATPNGTVVTSVTKNEWAIDEMNALPGSASAWPAALGGGPVGEPAGVTISGDLIDGGDAPGTAVNGCNQWANFTSLYGLRASDGRLRYNVYEGRGNHDADNSTSALPPHCATNPSRAIIARNKERAADASFNVTSIESATGLHYSWDWSVSARCKIHFVHLNLFPGHACGSGSNAAGEGPAPGFSCRSGWTWPEESLGFLAADLAAHAAAPGTMVVTLQHYGYDGWSNTWYNEDQRVATWDILTKYNTLAVLVGHTHGASVYAFNGTAQSNEFDASKLPAGFISVINAPATQKEDGPHNPLPSEFMALDATVDDEATGAGTFRVAQRVGSAWGSVQGTKGFKCY